MTTTDDKWSTEREQPAPVRRRVPRWVWGCGIGCGLFAVLGLVVLLLVMRSAMKMVDPEHQWERLGEVVRVVERPADCEIMGAPSFVKLVPGIYGIWTLEASDGSWRAEVQAFDPSAAEVFSAMFTGEGAEDVSVPWIGIGFYDAEPGTLAVQGRELRTLRYRTQRPDQPGEAPEASEPPEPREPPDTSRKTGWLERTKVEYERELARSAVNVDVTPDPPGEHLVMIQYSTPRVLERIGDEELAAFLAHFDLGGD